MLRGLLLQQGMHCHMKRCNDTMNTNTRVFIQVGRVACEACMHLYVYGYCEFPRTALDAVKLQQQTILMHYWPNRSEHTLAK